MHNVLVTAIGGNIGQGVLKSLRAANREYFIVGIDMEPLSAGFSLSDKYYKTSRAAAPGFREELIHIIKKEKIEAIYVCSPTELDFYSANRDTISQEQGVTIFVNPPEVVKIGSDKLLTAEFLKRSGFSYPETVMADDEKGIGSLIRSHGFPLIVKPRKGFTSINVFVVNSIEEIAAIRVLMDDIVVQRFIPEEEGEYTAGTISGPDAKVKASIILRRHINSGTTYRTELVQDEAMTFEIVKIAEALGAIGPCNFQFRILDGAVSIFEINPRFSGTAGIRYLYGFNDPDMLFEIYRLKLQVTQPELHQAVVLRYWNEIFIPDINFNELREGKGQYFGKQTIIGGPAQAKGSPK